MRLNDFEFTVLVNDHPITEYPYSGKVYIEGRAGSEYKIEVKNHSYVRIEAVLSVDGLSVLDGKPAGLQSTGYVLKAYDTMRIPGWTLDRLSVAKFAFAGKDGSYATQMTGDSRNNGVIGLMIFRERSQVPCVTPLTWTPTYTSTAPSPTSVPTWTTWHATSTQNMGSNWQAMGVGSDTASRGLAANASVNAAVTPPMVDQTLGTAFGESTTFATTNVTFVRAPEAPTILTLYYDERRGLKARGIRIGRPFKPQEQPLPQAFPLMGCQPPPGWQG